MTSKMVPPDVEEQVGCNLIPMVDIMFLLLLFFMLSADMSQRELEDVTLPEADEVQEDKNVKEESGISNVNVFHSAYGSAATCPALETRKPCNVHDHWRIAIRGKEYTPDTIMSGLKEEAALEMEDAAASGGKTLSARKVMVRADSTAPYGFVQAVMQGCALTGIYKIELAAAKPMP